MKRLFLLFTMCTMVAAFGLQAQSSSCASKKSACCKKSASAASTELIETNDAAAKLASMDETIEQRSCGTSGKVSYVRLVSEATDSEPSYVPVVYDSEANQFVDLPESEWSKCCASSGAGCCKGAKSVSDDPAKGAAEQPKLMKASNVN